MMAGTWLLTPDGYQPVDVLRRGDQVETPIGRGPLFRADGLMNDVSIRAACWRSTAVPARGHGGPGAPA